MISDIKQRLDRKDEGFTLIELMVVVLIIAILLAIAIPTFLGARNTANARSAQSDLRNALTAEQTYWTNSQSFTSTASSIEPSLTWESAASALVKGAKDVYASVQSNTNQVLLVAWAKDNNCYAIAQSNDPSGSYTAYAEYNASSTGCAAPSFPSAAPTASGNGAVTSAATWYTAW